mmetsp:Transcript_36866/g.67545  ORF Transcript_36866/g.67545 Transcript_36866/m.67545 type:complete len:460 (-) Transcript_36866:178-1557(-)
MAMARGGTLTPVGVLTPMSSARRSRTRSRLHLPRSIDAVLDSTAGAGAGRRPSDSASIASGDLPLAALGTAVQAVNFEELDVEDEPPSPSSEAAADRSEPGICTYSDDSSSIVPQSASSGARVGTADTVKVEDAGDEFNIDIDLAVEEPEEASSHMAVARSTGSSMMAHVAVYCFNSRLDGPATTPPPLPPAQATPAKEADEIQRLVDSYESKLQEMQAEVVELRKKAHEAEVASSPAPVEDIEEALSPMASPVVASQLQQHASDLGEEQVQRFVKCDVWRFQPVKHSDLPVRLWPKIDAQPTGDRLQPGDYFLVSERRMGENGVVFLRLAGGLGWVPNRSPLAKGALCVPHCGRGLGTYSVPPAARSAAALPLIQRSAGRRAVASMPDLAMRVKHKTSGNKAYVKRPVGLTSSAAVSLPPVHGAVSDVSLPKGAATSRQLSPKPIIARARKPWLRPWY